MATYDLGLVVGADGQQGPAGADGADGNGIASIELLSTSGLVKTYRITFDDGDHFDYQVTDGSDASVTIQTSWGSPTSDSKVASEKLVKDSLDAKVTATKVTSWSSTTSDSNVPSEKLVKDSIDSINTLIGNAISYINQ